MVKINFSGGEPFLPERGSYVGELVKFCKHELDLESVTIVSNGSLIKEAWFAQYGTFCVVLLAPWAAGARRIFPGVGKSEGLGLSTQEGSINEALVGR